MIYDVYIANKQSGYLVGNIYFPDMSLSYFTNSDIKSNGKISCKKVSKCIKTDSGYTYPSYKHFLNKTLVGVLIGNLRSANLKVADVLFIDYDSNLIDVLDMSYKPVFDCSSKYTKFSYTIVNNKCEEIGFLISDSDVYGSSKVMRIAIFEVINKREGWGKCVVNYLTQYKTLNGLSVVSSFPFWEKLGAKFSSLEDLHFIIEKC